MAEVAAEDVNAGNEHTIEQRSTPSSPPSTPSQTDEVLYCHFIPQKEFVEKGTPWIIHTKAKCYVCSTVNFESMAMMRTAGPGGEAPDPVVCHCGVSRHHLRLEGYVSMSKENTPHPVATIRSHRESTLANIPAMQQKLNGLEANIKELNKKNKSQALALKANHEDHSKLRATINDWKKKLAEREEKLDSALSATRATQAKLQQKELQVNQMQEQLQALREGGSNGGGRARQQNNPTATKHENVLQKMVKLQAEVNLWKAKAESQEAARGRLEVTTQDLRKQLEDALAKTGTAASRTSSSSKQPHSPAEKPENTQKLGKLQAEMNMWKAKAESQGAARGRLEATVQDLRKQLEDASTKAGTPASRTSPSSKRPRRRKNKISQKTLYASADVAESDQQGAATDSEEECADAAADALHDSNVEGDVVEDLIDDRTAVHAAADGGAAASASASESESAAPSSPAPAAPAPAPAHVESNEAEKRLELDADVEENLSSPRDGAGSSSRGSSAASTPVPARALRAAAGEGDGNTQAGESTVLQVDGALVRLAPSGPPATLGGSYLSRRQPLSTLDGRGVTAADLIRQAQQRRATASTVNSQPIVPATTSGAGNPANAAIAESWGPGGSAYGLAHTNIMQSRGGAIGLRGPSSTGANLQGRSQPVKNWGGNPFGGAGGSSAQSPGLAVLGTSTAWTPIVAGGVQFRGRRR